MPVRGDISPARGPRLETVAEVQRLSLGCIVGFDGCKRGNLAVELGLDLAALCPMDIYAKGGDETSPTSTCSIMPRKIQGTHEKMAGYRFGIAYQKEGKKEWMIYFQKRSLLS